MNWYVNVAKNIFFTLSFYSTSITYSDVKVVGVDRGGVGTSIGNTYFMVEIRALKYYIELHSYFEGKLLNKIMFCWSEVTTVVIYNFET